MYEVHCTRGQPRRAPRGRASRPAVAVRPLPRHPRSQRIGQDHPAPRAHRECQDLRGQRPAARAATVHLPGGRARRACSASSRSSSASTSASRLRRWSPWAATRKGRPAADGQAVEDALRVTGMTALAGRLDHRTVGRRAAARAHRPDPGSADPRDPARRTAQQPRPQPPTRDHAAPALPPRRGPNHRRRGARPQHGRAVLRRTGAARPGPPGRQRHADGDSRTAHDHGSVQGQGGCSPAGIAAVPHPSVVTHRRGPPGGQCQRSTWSPAEAPRSDLLEELVERGSAPTVGVVSVFDTDYTAAQKHELEVVSSPPFEPFPDEVIEMYAGLAREADVIIVAPVFFGRGNLAPLRTALEAMPLRQKGRGHEHPAHPERDLSDGEATKLVDELLAAGAISSRGRDGRRRCRLGPYRLVTPHVAAA